MFVSRHTYQLLILFLPNILQLQTLSCGKLAITNFRCNQDRVVRASHVDFKISLSDSSCGSIDVADWQ
ncbi:hypothetical protein MtrunA17_Chr7g0249371 [Medicago truncatula]|uniref:Uncharacterized protein n=1 Tax=Medicago truncatula TaxID=3880 RepID=A0A396H1J5_MEDTR|nr:hypothetical protein MtrunA17_Chr7g0249371 [Medicago truncatula]